MDTSEECFVAFMDIMGFADFVERETSESVHSYLSSLVNASSVFNINMLDYDIKVFSDTVVVSTVLNNRFEQFRLFLLYINTLQLASITEQSLGILPLRGAITKGDFFTDNKDLTFGKALIKAHDIEKKLANYPRIIVDPDELQPEKSRKSTEVVNSLLSKTGFDKKIKGGLKPFDEYSEPVRRDFDGLLHCNYLSALRMIDGGWAGNAEAGIVKHKQYIEDNLKRAPSNRVTVKYNWMKTYHNWFCGGYDELNTHQIVDTFK